MSFRRVVLAALLAVTSLGLTTRAHASAYAQQGSKLVGTGAVGNAIYQGRRVALSADGNTLISGGFGDNANSGAAWVFTRSSGVWSQQGAKLVGTAATGAPERGFSVALSADGNTALVGGPADNSNLGALWVFVRSGGVWTQQGIKITPTGAVGAASLGDAVALSADGNTALVGAHGDNGGAGAVWVFTRSGVTWSQQGPKLVGSGATGLATQGYSVALSSDGNTALVGGYTDTGSIGAAWVFTRSAGVWSQQGAKLVGTGYVGSPAQGESVALSGDGNTALIGGFQDNPSVGAVWTFTRSGGVWTQQGSKLFASDAIGAAAQGFTVAISTDGSTALVSGYPDNSGVGASWVYSRGGNSWTEVNKLAGTGASGAANQGIGLALSADGSTGAIGGYMDTGTLGAAWVFVRASPLITSIADVPNDQGGRVSIRWNASLLDEVPSDPIDQYWIWRQVPPPLAATLSRDASARARLGAKVRATRDGLQTYYWEYVGSQISHGFDGYSYTAPTLFDSIPGSNPLTLFMVEAERTGTGEYWSSDPDSGYSVDNLAPATPSPFLAAYGGGATHLHWGENLEADLSVYRLYRGVSAGFVPGPGNLVASPSDTNYVDIGPAGSYYKLSAVDIHGNESGFALVSPNGTLAAPGPGLPSEVSLARVSPDPLRGGGAIRFALPRAATVSLAIYDASGRRVKQLASGLEPAGEHSVQWDGRDTAGQSPASGVYFVRLDAAGRSLTSRFVRVQ